MHNPSGTYRIQFHKGFTFKDFTAVLPYLTQLGVGTIYASPIFEAVSGSTHGYDTINPLQINPEIGNIGELKTLSAALKKLGISWIQDIVPNHMAYDGHNAWLMDIFESGPHSHHYPYFDQSLSSTYFKGPIMVPCLAHSLQESIMLGEVKLTLSSAGLAFAAGGQHWACSLNTYEPIFGKGKDQVVAEAGTTFTKEQLEAVNSQPEKLIILAEQQYFRLCNPAETDHTINFRRFFAVNGLIGLNIGLQGVFDHFHQLIAQLIHENIFQGLRVDHIDGLTDPSAYLNRLRQLAGGQVPVYIEKILGTEESLAVSWPVQGTTGYDFLAKINNLFTRASSEKVFSRFYTDLVPESDRPVAEQIRQKKALFLHQSMNGELANLYRLFIGSDLVSPEEADAASADAISAAIAGLLVHCPVYRYYGNSFPLQENERRAISELISSVRQSSPELDPALILIESVLLRTEPLAGYDARALNFYQRLIQLTGPLMAKGVEDTLMYTFNRFIGHNEVGDSPASFGFCTDVFNEWILRRQQHWPLSMNATSTHDTKRGEDSRARLNVLTDLSEEWFETVRKWQTMNRGAVDSTGPDANDEYLIYQALIASWPASEADEVAFPDRITAYLEKAQREAKTHTGYAAPNVVYELACRNFTLSLLDKSTLFYASFAPFCQKIASFGIINSLAQTILKFMLPGMPDVYQGCEHWDLSLVDPDNRRPVDYLLREKLLADAGTVSGRAEQAERLWLQRSNGAIKIWLTSLLFKERTSNPEFFLQGEYIPLVTRGRFAANIFAFARRHRRTWYITAVPMHTAGIFGSTDFTPAAWDDTCIVIPQGAPARFLNILTGASGSCNSSIRADVAFSIIPFAVLKLEHDPGGRDAGLLLHITSLPSSFGIGDLGPEATRFIDFLAGSMQTWWQVLPLGPVSARSGYSPYNADSSLAGNTLLISPELLQQAGLLTREDLDSIAPGPVQPDHGFSQAEQVKNKLFTKAWEQFNKLRPEAMTLAFADFCQTESSWLSEYSLYVELKQHYDGSPWYEWPSQYKLRDAGSLAAFRMECADQLLKTCWLQFLFFGQWRALRNYARQKGVRLIGDLPFYAGYDSVDVWSAPSLFSLNEDFTIRLQAGVPPDYFNENGQLWGMPVFNWDAHRADNFAWWTRRVKKNSELFDLTRIDHFRAFASYWAVPGDDPTAIHGAWVDGPGADLLRRIAEESGGLPFIAEDLGETDEQVYALRDEFVLSGMKVIQFAFGPDLPYSPHSPHNYTVNFIAYTGTHDNNTLTGWYQEDIDQDVRKRLEHYLGMAVSDSTVVAALIRSVLASVARTAIIPVQDLLGLGSDARMNVPARPEGNWGWRLLPGQLNSVVSDRLAGLTSLFNRV